MHDVGILGGGITGLFLAWFLGGDSEVLESKSRAGGLARSFGGDGFRSDVGAHILFSKDSEALAHELSVLAENVLDRERANRILFRGQLVDYPFENGIGALPVDDRVDIVASFLQNPHAGRAPATFHDWIVSAFGEGLASRYLLPYNRKIWKLDPAEMGVDWVGRVPRIEPRELVAAALGKKTEGYVEQLHFHYPARGGFEALPQALCARLGPRVVANFPVTSIRKTTLGFDVESASGEVRAYRKLVSTMPTAALLTALGGEVPRAVFDAASALRFNALSVVLVGVEGQLPPLTAVYVPDPRSIYHRVGFNRTFSPDNVPAGDYSSVSCEITMGPGSVEATWNSARLVGRVLEDLEADELVPDAERVVFAMVHHEPLAYVVPDLGSAARMRTVRDFVESQGIELAGRFAEHRYINTDACVRRALDLARMMRGGDVTPEARI